MQKTNALIVGLLQIRDNYKLIFFVKLDVKLHLTKLILSDD